MFAKKSFLLVGIAFGVGACAAIPPTAPSVVAIPPSGKELVRFQHEDLSCRDYAAAQIARRSPANAATPSEVGSAAASSAVGASEADASSAVLQQLYDIAYTQCMAANGDQLQSLPYATYAPYVYGYPLYYGAWAEPAIGFSFVGRSGPRFHHRFFIHRGGFQRR